MTSGNGATSYRPTEEGQTTRDVVHDLKNLLTPILGYVQLVLHDLPSNDAQYNRIQKIQRAALSARDLMLHTLNDSSGTLSSKPLDLNGQIRAFVETIDGMIPDGVRLELDLAGDGDVVADARDVQRVLMNLIANACQAMPEGGVLLIRTARVSWLQPWGVATNRTAQVVRISVQDTGCGIPPENIERIFESGFTTRSEGNGLGMTCVQRIVQGCGGWVDVDSIPGAGTAMHVFLPCTRSAMTASKAG